MNSDLLHQRGLSLDRLDSFCRVVTSGSISQAAVATGSKAGAARLSRQISDLEEFFGVSLLERTSQGVIPTPMGKELFEIARNNLQELGDLRSRCAGLRPILRITAGNSMIHWRIGPLLEKLHQRFPNVQWELHARRSFERVPAVRNHEFDFAIVRDNLVSAELKSTPLLTIHHRLFLRRDLLQRAGTEDVGRLLQKLPLALPPEGDFRLALNDAVKREGIGLNIALQVTSFTMAACAVRSGAYAAILPHIAGRDFDEAEFASYPLPLMKNYVHHLHLCFNTSVARVSAEAATACQELHQLWCGD